MRTYRFYVINRRRQPDGNYEIFGWSRTRGAADNRLTAGGHVVYAGDRKQAIRIARKELGIEVKG